MPTAARPALRALAESSIALISSHQHSGGAYPACPTYPVYRYSWLRDSSFIADAMSRAGQPESADAFHRWCAGVIDQRRDHIAGLVGRAGTGERIEAAQMLPTRYTLAGGDGDEPWWDYQLDGYGTWLWALAEHARRHLRPLDRHRPAVESIVDYLIVFGTDSCYDWWEEHAEHRHLSTLGAVAAGLRAIAGTGLLDTTRTAAALARATDIEHLAAEQGTHDGHLTKWLGSTAVDGSLLACLTPLRLIEPGSPVAERTYQKIRADLLRGGVYRYLGDTFYGGGEWIILTAWLGWYEARTGRAELAWQRLEWIAAQATAAGLPEQVSDLAQSPDRIEEWARRWGPVATPLLWSHAMYLTLACELGVL